MTFSRLQKALLNYVEHREKLQGIANLEQADVDQIVRPADQIGSQRVEERMPKSIDPLTLDKVKDAIKQLDTGEGINAENAPQCGCHSARSRTGSM